MRVTCVNYIHLTFSLENLLPTLKFLQWTLFLKCQLYSIHFPFLILSRQIFMIQRVFFKGTPNLCVLLYDLSKSTNFWGAICVIVQNVGKNFRRYCNDSLCTIYSIQVSIKYAKLGNRRCILQMYKKNVHYTFC